MPQPASWWSRGPERRACPPEPRPRASPCSVSPSKRRGSSSTSGDGAALTLPWPGGGWGAGEGGRDQTRGSRPLAPGFPISGQTHCGETAAVLPPCWALGGVLADGLSCCDCARSSAGRPPSPRALRPQELQGIRDGRRGAGEGRGAGEHRPCTFPHQGPSVLRVLGGPLGHRGRPALVRSLPGRLSRERVRPAFRSLPLPPLGRSPARGSGWCPISRVAVHRAAQGLRAAAPPDHA